MNKTISKDASSATIVENSASSSGRRLQRLVRVALGLAVLALAVNLLLSGPVEDWWWSRKPLSELGREAIAHPEFPRLQYQLGRKLHAAGKKEEALVAYSTALRLQPDERRNFITTAELMVEAGHLDQAEGLLAGALERWPRDGKLRMAYADVLARLDLWPVAAEEQAKAIQDLPTAQVTARQVGALATFQMEANQYSAAAESFTKAIQIKTDEPGVHRGLGSALVRLGRSQEAIRPLEVALRQMPKDVETRYLLGRAKVATGDARGGEQLLLEALRADPHNSQIHLQLGKLEASRKRWSAATKHFEQALRTSPRNVEALDALAAAFTATGNPQAASEAHRRAEAVRADDRRVSTLEEKLTQSPEDAAAMRELSLRYLNQGRIRQATRQVLRLLTISPKDTAGLELRRKIVALKRSGLVTD